MAWKDYVKSRSTSWSISEPFILGYKLSWADIECHQSCRTYFAMYRSLCHQLNVPKCCTNRFSFKTVFSALWAWNLPQHEHNIYNVNILKDLHINFFKFWEISFGRIFSAFRGNDKHVQYFSREAWSNDII